MRRLLEALPICPNTKQKKDRLSGADHSLHWRPLAIKSVKPSVLVLMLLCRQMYTCVLPYALHVQWVWIYQL